MRLDIIYKILLDNKINLTTKSINTGAILISDLFRFKESINNIEKTGTFQDKIKRFKNSALYNIDTDYYELQKNDASIIIEINEFVKEIKVFTDNLKYILPKEKNELIYIKLPEIKELDDLSEFNKDIKLILNQLVINKEINGSVVFEGVESGTSWYKIYISTNLALALIGSAVWSATVIQKKMAEVEILEEQATTLKYKNNNLKSLTEANKLLLNTYLEIEAHKIADEHFKDYNNEQVERLKNSIKSLTELINKGVEVQPALSAPEDVKQLYLGMNQLGNAKTDLKKLKE